MRKAHGALQIKKSRRFPNASRDAAGLGESEDWNNGGGCRTTTWGPLDGERSGSKSNGPARRKDTSEGRDLESGSLGGVGNLMTCARHRVGGNKSLEVLAEVAMTCGHLDYSRVDGAWCGKEGGILLFELQTGTDVL